MRGQETVPMAHPNFDPVTIENLSDDERAFVIEVLEMHRALLACHQALPDKAAIPAGSVRFGGFDGETERALLAYARQCCEDAPGERYQTLGLPGTFSTHGPRAGRYRAMIREWKQSAHPESLTAADIRRIVEAR